MATTTESTPLSGGGQQQQQQSSNVFSSLFKKENIQHAGGVAKSRFDELYKSAKDGDISIRLLALLGGVALVVAAVLGFIQHLFSLEITRALLEIYTFALGIIMILLESHQLHLPESFLQQLYKYALFLKFVWGRGLLYFVAGSLQLAQGGLLDYVIGGFVMLVGVLYIIVGRQTAKKLHDLHKNLYSEQTLRSKFQEADTQNTGSLDMDQFAVLTNSLGMNLNRRELEAAFLHLDKKEADGKLTYDEFQSWWNSWGSEQSFGGMIV